MKSVNDYFDEFHKKQLEQQRHNDLVLSQLKIAESNKQVANEVHGIRNALQEQIDNNREQIKESKFTEKKLAKRSWWQFGLSLFIAIAGVIVAIIALFR